MTDDVVWSTHPGAEALVARLVADALGASDCVRTLAARLSTETSTQLMDWLDHIGGEITPVELSAAGFVNGHGTVAGVWRHPEAQLPGVVPGVALLALRVDDAAAFSLAQHGSGAVDGSPGAGLRVAEVAREPVRLVGVERRSWASGAAPVSLSDDGQLAVVRARRLWAERARPLGISAGIEAASDAATRMVALVGEDLAASYAMEVERAFWQRRNTAGALQYARQDRLGLGWGNHDHHTFRCSRQGFRGLIEVLQVLGFGLRERFYAGDEAGWGAQVLEQPGAGIVVFADVDLTPSEVAVDFAAVDLPATTSLGTVGLWCALHGESLLAAGMHHLEGQFDFDRLRVDLAGLGVEHMAPFSELPHLRQAFTEPERWRVDAHRLADLVASGAVSGEQARRFATSGAAGSHLENLARRGGFKGFNQTNVSVTMRATDPRVLT
jgi:hypothetical protein